MQLGKSKSVIDPRTLSIGNYLIPDVLPPAPAQYHYTGNIGTTDWGMMANDKTPDCTCAAAGHLIMEWTDDNGSLFTPADQDIIDAYSAITGYDPATGANSNEASAKDALNYWRNTGIAGHKILAYAALEPQNHSHVMQSVYLFGGCYVGLSLPLSAQTQATWSVSPPDSQLNGTKGSWGGHVVPVIGYDDDGLTVVTWGATKIMTWDFWNAYCDESYAIISIDFADTKAAPNGFNLSQLQADLKRITG